MKGETVSKSMKTISHTLAETLRVINPPQVVKISRKKSMHNNPISYIITFIPSN